MIFKTIIQMTDNFLPKLSTYLFFFLFFVFLNKLWSSVPTLMHVYLLRSSFVGKMQVSRKVKTTFPSPHLKQRGENSPKMCFVHAPELGVHDRCQENEEKYRWTSKASQFSRVQTKPLSVWWPTMALRNVTSNQTDEHHHHEKKIINYKREKIERKNPSFLEEILKWSWDFNFVNIQIDKSFFFSERTMNTWAVGSRSHTFFDKIAFRSRN